MKRLLVLRPEPGASTTVAAARALGLDVLSVPLFTIEAIAWDVPDVASFDALLVTSANAVRCAGDKLQQLHPLQVYAVGEATAQAAREAGFEIVATGSAGADRLLGSIEPGLRLVHLCGADRHQFDHRERVVTAVPVYRARTIDAPDMTAARGSIALVHSARAGHRFAELIEERGDTTILAISEAAAEAAGHGWERVKIADQPSDHAMLALAALLCNKPGPE